MAAPAASRPRLAVLDTNILLHLAEEHCPSRNLVLRLIRAGMTPVVTQTVVQELLWATEHAEATRCRQSAEVALRSMLSWGIQPIGLKPVGNGIQDIAADVILNRGLLPENERHDAYIVIEAGLMAASMLVTWDRDLLDASEDRINEVLKSLDIDPVQIVSPKAFGV